VSAMQQRDPASDRKYRQDVTGPIILNL